MSNKLFYFTDSYPYSVDFAWKSKEIEIASKEFAEVHVFPFSYKTKKCCDFPDNVFVHQPFLKKDNIFVKPLMILRLLISRLGFFYFTELTTAFKNGKSGIISWAIASRKIEIILKSRKYREIIEIDNKESIKIFFAWTMHSALVIPFFKKEGFPDIRGRMHGYDLYEFRHNNYIPYKKRILRSLDKCYFISELSISRVVPLKRIHLIVEALKLSKIKIEWIHIGDGYGFDDLKKAAKSIKNSLVNCEFLGWLNTTEILDYYRRNQIDAFILTSETEGLPVAIMEAFSAGIACIATNVGGVSELVSSETGILLPPNPSPREIYNAIANLQEENEELKRIRKEKIKSIYNEKFNLVTNSKKLINDFI